MGPFSSGNPSSLLSVLVLGTTLAVQLHARGLRSVTQGGSTSVAAVAAAQPSTYIPYQQPWTNTTGSRQMLMLTSSSSSSSSSSTGLPPASGTTDPQILALIPPLLAPIRCKIRREPPQILIKPEQLQMVGRPQARTAARAARMQARHLALLLQQQQQQGSTGVDGLGWVSQASDPPADYSEVLSQHNSYRARHQAPAMQWDGLLAGSAAAYAAQCVFEHDASASSGENLYASAAISDTAASLRNAIRLWYSEVSLYDFNSPGFSGDTSHFTQVVWRSSSSLGCVVQLCTGGIANTPFTAGTLVICRYAPPGNVLGRFDSNVLPVPQPPAPPASVPPASPSPAGTLPAGHSYVSPGCLVSVGEAYWLCMQNDGNVVLFRNKQPIWASNSAGRSSFRPFKLTMQKDGNLVASDNLRQNVWLSGTAGQGTAPLRLVVQEDGAAVILDADDTPRWTTSTGLTQAVLMQRGAAGP